MNGNGRRQEKLPLKWNWNNEYDKLLSIFCWLSRFRINTRGFLFCFIYAYDSLFCCVSFAARIVVCILFVRARSPQSLDSGWHYSSAIQFNTFSLGFISFGSFFPLYIWLASSFFFPFSYQRAYTCSTTLFAVTAFRSSDVVSVHLYFYFFPICSATNIFRSTQITSCILVHRLYCGGRIKCCVVAAVKFSESYFRCLCTLWKQYKYEDGERWRHTLCDSKAIRWTEDEERCLGSTKLYRMARWA